MTGEKVYPIDVALMNKRTDAFAGENLDGDLKQSYIWSCYDDIKVKDLTYTTSATAPASVIS